MHFYILNLSKSTRLAIGVPLLRFASANSCSPHSAFEPNVWFSVWSHNPERVLRTSPKWSLVALRPAHSQNLATAAPQRMGITNSVISILARYLSTLEPAQAYSVHLPEHTCKPAPKRHIRVLRKLLGRIYAEPPARLCQTPRYAHRSGRNSSASSHNSASWCAK